VENNFQRLYKQLHYEFKTPAYLKQALTHCSAAIINNERFEFLGDSILSFVISNDLFKRFPDYAEGELSRLRAHLVKGETLAKIALEIELGDYLYLGQGELKSGGFRRASILTDALEAIFAAVWLDGGFDVAAQVILHLYQTRLIDKNLRDNLKDAKTKLQEYLQAQKKSLPEYTLTKTEGEEHHQIFHVECNVLSFNLRATGKGESRRQAEQEAAKNILKKLNETA
jgi:ribonuclease-3